MTVTEHALPGRHGRVERADLATDVVATLALLAYSIAVAAGFGRVFGGWDFLPSLVGLAVVGHATSFALRRVRAPIWVAFPVLAAVLAWTVAALAFRDTFTLGLPTSATLDALRAELDFVGSQFRDAIAPVPFAGGWDVLATIGLAASVLLADTFAFRAYARAESLVPGGVLFVFVAALGTDRDRVASTVALVGAGVVATAVLRLHHAPPPGGVIGRRSAVTARALPLAVGVAVVVAVVAGVAGPRLPGARAEPLYDTKGGDGGSVTEVVNPLVDIRSRLTNRRATRLFSVTADAESYWRSAALADFDGQVWSIPTSDIEGLEGPTPGGPGSVTVRQEITIDALGGSLVPAAPDATSASPVGEFDAELKYNRLSSALVKAGTPLTTGDVVRVESASPRRTAAELAVATSDDPGDPVFLALPDDLPETIGATTREVVGDARSPYEAARRLQDWMRSEFRYDLDVQEGHGASAIEAFLRDRIGYCEQFAGTYAAMLRTIGVPTRVAVGFTQGEGDGAGGYVVRGRNAHAWPEVWFDGVGWVPFEPTPGRGAPNAQDHTGVAPQQDDRPLDDEGAGGAGGPTTTVATTIAPDPATGATTLPDQAVPGELPPQAPPAGGAAPAPAEPSGASIPWAALALLALLALAIASPELVRRARRAAGGPPREQLGVLWRRATTAVAELGADLDRSLTPAEAAVAASRALPLTARPMASLAEVVTEATFGPDGDERLARTTSLGTTTLQSCASWCRQVERAVEGSMTPTGRIRRWFTTWE